MIKKYAANKFCMFYELLETILLFGLRYPHLDLFQFLHRFTVFTPLKMRVKLKN